MKEDVVSSIEKYLISNMAKYANYSLGFFGGEPLLHPEIIKRISTTFRQEQLKFDNNGSIGITTNGHLIDIEILKIFEDINIDFYQISIDGPKDTHNSQRKLANGKETYDRIIENIKNILYFSSSKVYFRVNYDNSKTV